MVVDQFSFLVGQRAQSVVASNLYERSDKLIRTYAPSYFYEVATALSNAMSSESRAPVDGDENHLAAAIRLVYGQAVEAFFALLFSALQAPECPIAWLQSYIRRDILDLLRLIDTDQAQDLLRVQLKGRGWMGVAATMNDVKDTAETPRQTVIDRYETFWRHLAKEYVDPRQQAEFNSIKHGFRITGGGFTLGIGRSTDSMASLGGSDYGSQIQRRMPLSNAPPPKKTNVFGLHRTDFSWDPPRLVLRLGLIRDSLTNILQYLLAVKRGSMADAVFEFEDDSETWIQAGVAVLGVGAFDLDTDIPYDAAFEPDRDAIMENYRNQKVFFLNPSDIHRGS